MVTAQRTTEEDARTYRSYSDNVEGSKGVGNEVVTRQENGLLLKGSSRGA